MWHEWVKSFRIRHNVNQEQAAHLLGVDARTVRRWEAGHPPSNEHRHRLAHVLMPIVAERIGSHLANFLNTSTDIVLLLDPDLRLIGQSKPHRDACHRLYGRDCMLGEDWLRWMPTNFRTYIVDNGGSRALIQKGIVSIRGSFVQRDDNGNLTISGIAATTFLRLVDGVCILSIVRRIEHPRFVALASRNADRPPTLVTFLDP